VSWPGRLVLALRRLQLILIPPPAKRIGPASMAPLLLMLLLLGAAWVTTERLDLVILTSPGWLWLLTVILWIWWIQVSGRSGLRGTRAALALVTRLILIALLVTLMAEPRSVRSCHDLSLVYALDISDSVGDQAIDAALDYIVLTSSGRPQKDHVGLVVFGRDAGVELPPRLTFPFEGAILTRIARDGTNLEQGLALAAAMLPEERPGRIVLISDGAATEGRVDGALDELARRRIAVDVLPVEYQHDREVWLTKLELPSQVKSGDTFEASVVLSSLKAGSGRLLLSENGRSIFNQEIDFPAGKSRFSLPLYMRQPGFYEYIASVELPAGDDGWRDNNIAVGSLFVQGERRVLVAVDESGDRRDWTRLVQVLRSSELQADLLIGPDLPRDMLAYSPFDSVIMVNLPADSIDLVQMKALQSAVANLGTGLLMVGGKNSFAPGGYHRTPIEEALPVSMDVSQRKVLPKGALVIILHTCEFAEGNTWGKRITKQAIRVLGARDEVGVLVYGNNGEEWLFPLTPAAEYERLIPLINKAWIGDMPAFSTTMRMGLDALRASDAAVKHMIIISDGDPAPPPPELLEELKADKVSVSTVAVFPHGGHDESVMHLIAGATGGRYYLPQDPDLLPSIFVKEAKTLQRNMIQNVVFTPTAELTSPVLKGIDIDQLPELRAYVLTTPKAMSLTILEGPDEEGPDPVLVTWRYGIGKTAAFTSDLSPGWAPAWMEWQRLRSFVLQLVIDISRAAQQSHLRMRCHASGLTGLIEVEDHHPQAAFLEIQARVEGPRGQSEELTLRQTGPGRYAGEVTLWGKGRYQVTAVAVGEGRDEQALAGLAVPYSPEHLRFRSEPMVLHKIAEASGGRLLDGSETGEELFAVDREPATRSRPVTDLLLLVICCLIPIDVGVRRIDPDLAAIARWLGLGRREQASQPTLGALLARKQAVAEELAEKKQAEPEESRPAPPKAPTRRQRQSEPQPQVGKVQDDLAGLSTTERLLAMKRRRQLRSHDDRGESDD
jgi:uncharacterized membrane protein